MTDDTSARYVQATTTSLRILEFVREQGSTRLTDIARELDIGYSTAHNHLATLEAMEYLVEQNNAYKLSLKWLNFGRSARRNVPFFQTVRRRVTDLAEQTNLEVEFLVEEHGRIFTIIDIIRANATYGSIEDNWQGVGIAYNMTNTASGKAILAEFPSERVDQVIDKWGFDPRTPYSVTDRDVLDEQLEAARVEGYAKATQEVHEGFENVAAVVHFPDETIFGAISIGWPSYIFEDRIDQRAIDLLIETTETLEAEIAEEIAEENTE